MGRRFALKPWMGLLGLLGFLGFVPNHRGEPQYFACIFFTFFSFYFWAKLGQEQEDERLIQNQVRAMRIIAGLFALLSFFLLFFLQKSYIRREMILLWGSLIYSMVSVLGPGLVYYFDQVAK